MRALTMDEVGFVAGGWDLVIVTERRNPIGGVGGGGGVSPQQVGLGSLAERSATQSMEAVIDAAIADGLRIVNGSDPEGDRLIDLAIAGKNGMKLIGPPRRHGNSSYRTIESRSENGRLLGHYILWDHLFNGTGAWDRVNFVAADGAGVLTWNPGGFGGNDGYHDR